MGRPKKLQTIHHFKGLKCEFIQILDAAYSGKSRFQEIALRVFSYKGTRAYVRYLFANFNFNFSAAGT